jgi:hypothetical protein
VERTVENVCEQLHAAILGMPAGDPPHPEEARDFWNDYGRHSIDRWASDLERDLRRIREALAKADTEGRSDDGIAAIEEVLWRTDAAREKIEAIFSRCFGVSALVPYKQSVRFEPDIDAVKAKLKELGATQADARRLGELGQRLAEHPTTLLRNQLSHSLVAIGDATEVTAIQVATVRGDQIPVGGWQLTILYQEELLEHGDIGPEAVFTRARQWCGEALDLLLGTAESLACLVEATARLEPPQPLWKDETTGKVFLADPRLAKYQPGP